MFRVDERGGAAFLLRGGDHVERHGGLTGGLGSVDLGDPSPGHTADAQGQVQGQGTGGNGADVHVGVFAQFHDAARSELFLDHAHGGTEGFLLVQHLVAGSGGGGFLRFGAGCHVKSSRFNNFVIILYHNK